jgi:hypothetical protein
MRGIQNTAELSQDTKDWYVLSAEGAGLATAVPYHEVSNRGWPSALASGGGSQVGVRESPQCAGRYEDGLVDKGRDGLASARAAPAGHPEEPPAIASATS